MADYTKHKTLCAIFCIIFIATLFSAQTLFAYNPDTQDCFYLPLTTNPVTVDEAYNPNDWTDAKKFTFGTGGNTEVTVHGKYDDDYVYFKFDIDDEFFIGTKDELIICIDPQNAGEVTVENIPVRYDILASGTTTRYSMDQINGWQNAIYDYMLSAIHEGSNQWTVELRLDRNGLNLITDYFGLYFRVLNFIDEANDSLFEAHYWPTSATDDAFEDDYIPTPDEWANAQFFTNSLPTRPDIYFEPNDIVVNSENDLQVILGTTNEFTTTYRKNFPGGASDGTVENDYLTVKYAEFGADCFYTIETVEADVNDVETSGQKTVEKYIGGGPGTAAVTLRADFSCNLDAITSNNTLVRNMLYVRIEDGQTFKVPVTIGNCLEDGEVADPFDYTSSDISENLYASTMLLLPQQQYDDSLETIYFYVDRSGLTPGDKSDDTDWEITFTPIDTGENVVTPIADSTNRDFYKIALKPGATTTLDMKITPPTYFTPYREKSSLYQLYKWIKEYKLMSSLVMVKKEKRFSEVSQPTEYWKRFSTLRLKVYKQKNPLVINRNVYHRVETIGSFGVYLLVLLKPATFWHYVIIVVFIIVLVVATYFMYKLWKKRKWGAAKIVTGIVMLLFLGGIYYLIRVLLMII